jgi:preprotein translocase subunit SecE
MKLQTVRRSMFGVRCSAFDVRCLLVVFCAMLTKTKNFFNEVKVELQKASWPWDPKEKGFKRYKELFDSTGVVIISMLLLGGYVALFDFILVNVVHFFTRIH